MKKEKKIGLHFLAITALAFFVVLGLASASTPSAKNDYSYPQSGVTNNVNIAAKDFKTLGVIFVNSVEVIDSQGNHTGSKITYEMFMREAVKLGADDVINMKIDVNIKTDKETTKTITTYSYTGTGLAIKYTDAVNGTISGNSVITGINTSTPPVESNLFKGLKK